MRILAVVDDTPDVRRVVRLLLERSGATVEAEATSVDEAIDLIEPHATGAVILDHDLDGTLDGLDGARRLRGRVPGATIVVLSAHDLSSDVADDPAVDAFVGKGQILELPSVVRRLLEPDDPATTTAPAVLPGPPRLAVVRPPSVSAADALLLRWLDVPALLFGTLPPPIEAVALFEQLLHPTDRRSDTVLRFVAAAGDVDVAVGHLLALRELVDDAPDPKPIDVRLLDLLAVEATSNVIAAARRVAMVDPLTGLGNRRALDPELTSLVARAERTSSPVSVLYFDLVGLKAINDRQGHEEGDRALRAFAYALERTKRTGDRAYRIGGDEFLALLPDARASDAAMFAARLGDAATPAFTWGLADTDHDGYDAPRLVRLADVRMLAKRYDQTGDASGEVVDLAHRGTRNADR